MCLFFFFGRGTHRRGALPARRVEGRGKLSAALSQLTPTPRARTPGRGGGAALSRVWGGREDLFAKPLRNTPPTHTHRAHNERTAHPLRRVGEKGG